MFKNFTKIYRNTQTKNYSNLLNKFNVSKRNLCTPLISYDNRLKLVNELYNTNNNNNNNKNTNKIKPNNIGSTRKITSNINDKEFLDTGEWYIDCDEYFKIGITTDAVKELGELVYIENNYEVNDSVETGEDIIILESVKATDGLKAPFDCSIIENNDEIDDKLDQINDNPECIDNSWLVKVKKL